MKLLFGENLSLRLVRLVEEVYPGSTHVGEIGLLGGDDRRIWTHAAEQGFLLTSKDADFYQRSLVFGAPPKIVWLRIGNFPCTSAPASSAFPQAGGWAGSPRRPPHRPRPFPARTGDAVPLASPGPPC